MLEDIFSKIFRTQLHLKTKIWSRISFYYTDWRFVIDFQRGQDFTPGLYECATLGLRWEGLLFPRSSNHAILYKQLLGLINFWELDSLQNGNFHLLSSDQSDIFKFHITKERALGGILKNQLLLCLSIAINTVLLQGKLIWNHLSGMLVPWGLVCIYHEARSMEF